MQEINPMQGFEGTAKEATTAFREFAEKGIVQAKENYAKMKTAAEEATGILEHTYANASKGAADYGLSWWDALLWASARENDLSVIYSEDLPGAPEIDGVRYVDPFADEDG